MRTQKKGLLALPRDEGPCYAGLKPPRAQHKLGELTIRVANQPGVLGELTSALWAKGVAILGWKAEVSDGKAVIHLKTDKPVAARAALAEMVRSGKSRRDLIGIPVHH